MGTNVDALFFIDKSKAGDKQEADGFEIITNDDVLEESAPPDDQEQEQTKYDSNKADIILGYDKEEAELEQLVFGGKPESLFEEKNEVIGDIGGTHADQVCLLSIFSNLANETFECMPCLRSKRLLLLF